MFRLMLSILFATLWMPVFGIAQTATQPPAAKTPAVFPPARLAWMDLEVAIMTCDEGKQEVAEIQKFVEAKNAELETLRKEFESLNNQLKVQGSKLTDEARADLQDQVEAKDTALKRFQEDGQKDIENKRVRMTNYIGKRMLPVIEKVSKEKNINAVLFFNSSRDAWVDPSLNITEEIIANYNRMYPVAASKAPATPAKKP
jgi:Skp family chaperone for outer membrane proteins